MRYDRLIAVSAFALTAALAPLSAQAADIVETLKSSGQYSQLVDAIDKAGLTETLKGEGPYTVFAPTDEAFQKLQQGAQGQQQTGQGQQQTGQGQQQAAQGQQTAQAQQQGGDGQVLQQASSDQLKRILTHHVVEGQELSAQDLLGKEQKVDPMSGDQLTIDGTGTMLVLVPTGLAVSRIGDDVFVRREVAAMAQPAVTVTTAGQQGQQQSAQGQQQQGQQQSAQGQQQQGQQQAAQSGQQGQQGQQQAAQSGQQGQQGQQQAAAQSGQQGQQGQQQSGQQQAAAQSSGQQGQQQQAGGQMQGQEQPMAEQQGLLRAGMVVEPGIQADNGVIHGINEVLVPQQIEQELMSGQAQSGKQQNQG